MKLISRACLQDPDVSLEEEEVKAEEIREEEAEAKIEVEEISPANAQGRGSQSQAKVRHNIIAQGQRYDKSNVQCHYCKKYGHYANECRKKQHDMNNKQMQISLEKISAQIICF